MIHTLKNILAVLNGKEKKRFVFLIVLDIFISILDIASLAFLLFIIRFYLQPVQEKDFTFLISWLPDHQSLVLISFFAFLFGMKNWLGILISGAQFKFISKVAVRISRSKLNRYQHSGFWEFVNTDSSTQIRSIAFDPFEFSQYILSGIQQIITQCSLILLTITAIILFDAKLFLLLLLTLLPPVIIVFYLIKKKLFVARQHIQENNENSFRYLLDALKGFVESNIFQRNGFFLSRFTHAREQFSNHLFNSLALQQMPSRIIEIFAVLGLFILILIAKWNGNDNSSLLISIGAFMGAAYKIIPGIVKVINTTGQIKSYELTINGLKTMNDIDKAAMPLAGDEKIETIEFKGVHFRYNNDPVLTGLSFSICKGDFIGISGASGKGKTTIMNLVLGFLSPLKGEILINGRSVAGEEIKKFWLSFSYAKQQSFLINDSILRNISFEESGYDKASLDNAVKISGLGEILLKFPEGLETRITENGKNLSGGQQQRIALARALYKNAEVVLLDEPFNELDEEATQKLLIHFRELAAAGKLVVMITHDKNSLSFCNKIISLDQ